MEQVKFAFALNIESFIDSLGVFLCLINNNKCILNIYFIIFSATSMFESMWNSMSSSLRLAEECAKQDATNSQNSGQPYEGIENFAQTIESSEDFYYWGQ